MYPYYLMLKLCVVVAKCSPLSQPDNGILTEKGAVVEIACNEGFKINGSSSRRCHLNKQWSGNDAVCVGKT